MPEITVIRRLAVGRNKSADFGVVISRFKEVKLRFNIIIVRTITERIYVADITGIRNNYAVIIHNGNVSPRVVSIFYHNSAVTVKQRDNISLNVLSVDICRAVIFHARDTGMIIEKFQAIVIAADKFSVVN